MNTTLKAIDLALSLFALLASYKVNVAELVAEWDAARAEGRDVDVSKFKAQAEEAGAELDAKIAAAEGQSSEGESDSDDSESEDE